MDSKLQGLNSRSIAKCYFAGTHRTAAPEETWRHIEPLLHRFGVTRVADITGLDRIGFPVAIAVRPLSRSVVVAAGKGMSLSAAKVSAAMESLECAHAEMTTRPLLYASRAELNGARRVAPLSSLPRLRCGSIDDETRIVWTEGVDIRDGVPVLVPYELVHAHYGSHGLAGTGIFQATTNGLSSGNTFAEAVSHGLFEVIERDALNLWERGRLIERNARRLNLSFRDPDGVSKMVEHLHGKGFRVALWDITSDVRIPAFHCIIVDATDPNGHPGTGTGCHPDAGVALSRAICEAVQVRATYISGGRDDLMRREYDTRNIALFHRLVAYGADETPATLDITKSYKSAYFEDDIEWAVGRVAEAGCGPVIVVDLSLPDTGICVVRVIVPGLEGPPGDELDDGARARQTRP